MANVGFGLTQLDILGSGTPVIESSSGSIEFALGQGTPKIESTTGNLELKATEIRLNGVVKFGSATITIDGDNGFINTGIITANNSIEIGTGSEKVAISTNLAGGVRVGQGITFGGAGDALMTGITTVGKELQVGTGITISSGIITAINAIKVGTGITISSGVVTATSFVKSGGTSSQYLMADGSTSTGVGGATGVDFNGNVKVRFGTSNDLEIYHNGNHSIIDNTGTGDLKLIGDDVVIQASNDETMAKFIEDGSVDLYHDNSKKFETTSSGISVTGAVSATSFSGSGNDIVTSRWDVVGGGTYAFTGPGGLNGASQPKIYLARGQTYEFVISNASSHPFQIQQSNGTVYNTGVTNNGSSVNGVVVKFEVPFSAPNSLQYVCTVHGGMGNTIIVYPDLSP